MEEFIMKRLIALFILHSHNIKMLHWRIQGSGFARIHNDTNEYVSMMEDYLDKVAEIGMICDVSPMSQLEAIYSLKESGFDPRDDLVIIGSTSIINTKEQAYQSIKTIFDQLITDIERVIADGCYSGDIVSELQSIQYGLRIESQYKIKRTLLGD